MKKEDEWCSFLSSAVDQSFDGVGIAGLDNKILYVNPAWAMMHGYDSCEELIGNSIEIFHNREQIDKEVKPFIQAVRKAGRNTGEMGHIRKDGSPFHTLMTTTLLTDFQNRPVAILGIIKDITERRNAEEKLKLYHDHLEQMISERTKELEQKNIHLEEANIALKVLLKQREKDKKEIEDRILQNLEKLVFPYLEKLKTDLSEDNKNIYAEIIESNLNQIISPFSHSLSGKLSKLTPAEIRIADLIRQGRTNKEIAKVLQLSPATICTHRQNIRKKLSLTNRKRNLRSILSDH